MKASRPVNPCIHCSSETYVVHDSCFVLLCKAVFCICSSSSNTKIQMTVFVTPLINLNFSSSACHRLLLCAFHSCAVRPCSQHQSADVLLQLCCHWMLRCVNHIIRVNHINFFPQQCCLPLVWHMMLGSSDVAFTGMRHKSLSMFTGVQCYLHV